MGKQSFDPQALQGLTVETINELGNGFCRLTFSDSSAIVAQIVPLAMTVAKEKAAKVEEEEEEEVTLEDMKDALVESGEYTKKDLKKMKEKDIIEAYEALEEEGGEEDEGEEEVSIEDMKEALVESGEYTKKDLKKMDDDEIKEAYDSLEEEGEEESEEEEEESGITADELRSADGDDLEDIVDDQELDIDLEDYDLDDKKSVEKLRKAIAKELNIKL